MIKSLPTAILAILALCLIAAGLIALSDPEGRGKKIAARCGIGLIIDLIAIVGVWLS